jgi:hypothetical protein
LPGEQVPAHWLATGFQVSLHRAGPLSCRVLHSAASAASLRSRFSSQPEVARGQRLGRACTVTLTIVKGRPVWRKGSAAATASERVVCLENSACTAPLAASDLSATRSRNACHLTSSFTQRLLACTSGHSRHASRPHLTASDPVRVGDRMILGGRGIKRTGHAARKQIPT